MDWLRREWQGTNLSVMSAATQMTPYQVDPSFPFPLVGLSHNGATSITLSTYVVSLNTRSHGKFPTSN